MALIRTLRGVTPQIHASAFLAETAVLIGDVHIGEGSSVWYGAVLRGDVGGIRVGRNSNVQDLAMVHCTYERSHTVIHDEVTIGHGAVVHGCEIKDRCLIGMNAVVLDNAVVGPDVVVGAGSVVLEGMILEPGHIYAGIPAKKIKALTEKQLEGLKKSAEAYKHYAAWYASGE
jgi:carbonic anhydrase/acetyltransferase-like protein (isoleucine patch superfamily)